MRYVLECLVMATILAVVSYYDNIKHLNFSVDLKENGGVQFVVAFASCIALVIAIRLFLLPYFIARNRNHLNKIPILLTTLFFGWSLVGWLVAIIWSTTCNVEKKIGNEAKTPHPIPKPENYKPAAYAFVQHQPEPLLHPVAKKQITSPKTIRGEAMKKGWIESYLTPGEFVAIDFETANPNRTSACALAVCIVRNGEIAERQSWLIKPEPFYFGKIESRIHGITEKDVANAPEFLEIWPEVMIYLQHNHVVAHNASFDLSVLRAMLDFYGLEYPDFTYSCTVAMSRKAWPELNNHKLNTVASHLGIKFRHHYADDDAYACAMIANTIYREQMEKAA